MQSSTRCGVYACLVIILLFAFETHSGAEMVPFVIPAKANANSVVAYPASEPITTTSPRVTAREGHFIVGDKQIRFWGINLTFAANFPEHGDAEDLAVRLSQAGINCVRLHHMDSTTWKAPHGAGIWDDAHPTQLSTDALDRLDYLLDQLARHGIYADVNLHVSRVHSKYVGLPPVPGDAYDKMVDLFMPALIDAQKDYARQLLGHVNAYRKVRLADDPATAIVEINNEDSLFMWGAKKQLETLPKPYSGELCSRFNDWLFKKYGSTAKVETAWNSGAQPLGNENLAVSKWDLEVHPGNAAKLNEDSANVTQADGTSWHVQLQKRDLKLTRGQYYSLQFSISGDHDRNIAVGIGQSHEPWRNLGLDTSVKVSKDATMIQLGFVANADDDLARVSFQIGQQRGMVTVRELSLRTGGQVGLKSDETLEAKNISVFPGSQSAARALDVSIFLAEAEKAFWDGMRGFIKTDLKCNALVTGTIAFGPLGLYAQSDMDFIDAHAYWQHPRFPGRPWDMNNWTIEQEAMVDHPDQATLWNLACSRLKGKPFTVTEYCHPAPNDFQAECVPEIAAFAAAQNWDGVFMFDYGNVPSTDHFQSFFDNGSNPAKWAFMPSAARIFRDEAITPMPRSRTISLTAEADPLTALAGYQQKHGLDLFSVVKEKAGSTRDQILTGQTAVSLSSDVKPDVVETDQLAAIIARWSTHDGKGLLQFTGDAGIVWVKHNNIANSSVVTSLQSPEFAAIAIVAIDGQPFASTHRVLITAMGKCENTDMTFSNDRKTVGQHFGKGPACIETVAATLQLPPSFPVGPWKLQTVDGAGAVTSTADVVIESNRSLELKSEHATAWWILTR